MKQYTYRRLRGRIVEIYGTIDAFSKEIGRSKVSTSNKITGKTGFSQKDMEKWGKALNIPVDSYGDYFFT